MVLATSVILAGAIYVTIEAMQLEATNQALKDELFRPLSPPPARLMVCEGAMDAACAEEAADRIGTTVAWLDEPAGYELEWFLANRHAGPVDPGISDDGVIATQYLAGGEDGRGMFEVVTSVPPLPAEPQAPNSRLISNGTDTGSLWMDEVFGIASVEWTHDGIVYLITAQPRPWDPSAVVDAWKTIQYASPTSS